MTHMRYWAMSLATAICGGFIAIDRFAFAPSDAVWIAFSVAIVATVVSLAAFLLGLLREGHAFSALGAVNAVIGGSTIVATQVFADPTALWLAFAGGVGLLACSLFALAIHETTIERVVHALEARAPAGAAPAPPMPADAGDARRGRRLVISEEMRSWAHWLVHTGTMLGGAFVVLMSFALTAPGTDHPSPRWIALGVGIAATCMTLGLLLERAGSRERAGDRGMTARRAALATTGASCALAVAMVVTMIVLSGDSARWVAFALGCAMVGVSLVALTIHELTSERVRHELEIAAAPVTVTEPTPTAPAA